MKKTVLFAVILAMSILGFFGCNKIPSQSGTCGENLTWTYDARRQTLTISGTGDMVTAEKFQWSDFPIRSLVIEEGVTSVARSAFYSNHKLKGELKLPSTLREIGDFAFYGCEKLTGTLVLPDSVGTVGNYAFVRCEGLTGLVLSKNLKTIGDEAFHECTGLKGTLNFPEGLEKIGRVAFNECTGLRGDLILPDSLTEIGDYCFSQSGFDGTLRLPANLSLIPDNCFNSCESLRGGLVIPKGVKGIGERAFGYCGSLDGTLTFEGSPEWIGPYAFAGLKKMRGPLSIPDSVTFIGESAFYGDEGFDSLKLPAGLRIVCEQTFRGCSGLTGTLDLPDSLEIIGNMAFSSAGFTGALVLPPKLSTVGSGAFGSCAGFTSLELPDSLLSIRGYAFSGCAGLSGTLSIPGSVESVGKGAFSGCEKLAAVRFGGGVQSVGSEAFRDCAALASASFETKDPAPDYYGRDEEGPTFPETCSVDLDPSGGSVRDEWEAKRAEVEKKQKSTSGGDEAAREQPYYWTQSLTGEEFKGAGRFADVVLIFDSSSDAYVPSVEAVLRIEQNGRVVGSTTYRANGDDYENQTVNTDGFWCRGGWIRDLTYARGYRNADILTAELYADADGTPLENPEIIRFCTESEDNLWFEQEEWDQPPKLLLP